MILIIHPIKKTTTLNPNVKICVRVMFDMLDYIMRTTNTVYCSSFSLHTNDNKLICESKIVDYIVNETKYTLLFNDVNKNEYCEWLKYGCHTQYINGDKMVNATLLSVFYNVTITEYNIKNLRDLIFTSNCASHCTFNDQIHKCVQTISHLDNYKIIANNNEIIKVQINYVNML